MNGYAAKLVFTRDVEQTAFRILIEDPMLELPRVMQLDPMQLDPLWWWRTF